MGQTKIDSSIMTELADRLTATDLYGWELRRIKENSDQLYLIFDQVENLRRVETDKVRVQIYFRYEQEGKSYLGESGWVLNPGEDWEVDLTRALERAPLVANPIFTLPYAPQSYQSLPTMDEGIHQQPRQILWQIRNDLNRAVGKLDQTELASAEVFAEKREIAFMNHTGLQGEYGETKLSVQFALLAGAGAEEADCLGHWRTRFYRPQDLMDMVRRYGRYLQEGVKADLPPSGQFPVVFGEEALDTLFNHLTAQAGGQSSFQGWSRLRLGDPVITDPQGDLLTLISDPFMNGGLETRPFDERGLALRPINFVEKNVFKQVLADQRYADYLQIEPTGALTNLRVAPGATPLSELLNAGTVLHLLRFSTLEPNPVTGAVSGEIRTGYLIKDGRSVPIKGGSVSGLLNDAFRALTLSRETVQRESYYGPAGVRLEGMAVAGD
jgi:PmbA protein